MFQPKMVDFLANNTKFIKKTRKCIQIC